MPTSTRVSALFYLDVTTDKHDPAEANSLLTKEGVPTAADGAIDGVIDTEFNKYSKDL